MSLKRKDDILKAGRYRFRDKHGKYVYVTVAEDCEVGTPCELWVTLPDENKQSVQEHKTDITIAAALFSLARKAGAKFTATLEAMENCSYSDKAITSELIKVLKEHCPPRKAAMLEFEAEAREKYGEDEDKSKEVDNDNEL
jgi:hypothetical protein